MPEEIYFEPRNLESALNYLAEHKEATLWAGGTDLVIRLERKKLNVSRIVDLKSIQELRFIEDGDPIRIGALTTIHDLEISPVVKSACPSLAEAAHMLGSWQVRTLATIGGNIANAAPSADTATPIRLLDGVIVVQSRDGERKIPAALFFKGPGRTALLPGEIVKEIQLTKLPEGYRSTYLKESLRRSMDIALVNLGCVLKLNGDWCQEVRIGLGAVAPVPMRAIQAETLLTGQMMTVKIVEQAAQVAANECQPIDDIRATAGYRRELVRVLARRALLTLWKAGRDS